MENPSTPAPSTIEADVAITHDDSSTVADSDNRGSAVIEAELLIEEISIDGMCGVY